MRRRTLALVAAALAALTLPTPAGAKPFHRDEGGVVAVISGPGLDLPVSLRGAAAERMLSLTTFRGLGEPAPPRDLGPEYLATYLVPRGRRPPLVLV